MRYEDHITSNNGLRFVCYVCSTTDGPPVAGIVSSPTVCGQPFEGYSALAKGILGNSGERTTLFVEAGVLISWYA